MRELSESQDLGPSLFDAPPPESYVHAKDFVRWCCSFGDGFRNSPDITNLRFWAHKTKVGISGRHEREILETARPMFWKKIEQLVRKAEKAQAPN
jgi:hypothetical protein